MIKSDMRAGGMELDDDLEESDGLESLDFSDDELFCSTVKPGKSGRQLMFVCVHAWMTVCMGVYGFASSAEMCTYSTQMS